VELLFSVKYSFDSGGGQLVIDIAEEK
jgi:hypothetical protein